MQPSLDKIEKSPPVRWMFKIYFQALVIGVVFAVGSWFTHPIGGVWMRVVVSGLFILMALFLAYMFILKIIYKRRVQVAFEALEVMREGCLITDSDNRIVYVNKRYEEISGYSLKDVLGKNPSVLSSGRQDKAFYEALWASLHEKGYWEGEVWNRKRSGELYPQWTNISVVKGFRGKIRYHVGVFSDITSKKAAEEKIKRYAYYDPLTDLPNRRFFVERLTQMIKVAKREQQMLAVLFLDLDHFKPINDEHGHLVGDLFLKAFASLIQSQVREVDTVSRLGGDEFVVLLFNVGSKSNAKGIAQKILAACHAQPICVNNLEFPVSVCIGGAMYPEHASDSKALSSLAIKVCARCRRVIRMVFAFMVMMRNLLQYACHGCPFILHSVP